MSVGLQTADQFFQVLLR